VSARQYWDRHAGRYDRATRWLSRPLPRMLDLTVDAVRGSARVLEVAAGTGLVTTAIGPHVGEVVATDYASAMVAQLQERIRAAGLANVRCDQADLYRMTRPPASFDAVIAANVLHLVPAISPVRWRACATSYAPGECSSSRPTATPRLFAQLSCHACSRSPGSPGSVDSRRPSSSSRSPRRAWR
jgi:SAM-dependent methyltransferase